MMEWNEWTRCCLKIFFPSGGETHLVTLSRQQYDSIVLDLSNLVATKRGKKLPDTATTEQRRKYLGKQGWKLEFVVLAETELIPGTVSKMSSHDYEMFERLAIQLLRSSYRHMAWECIPDWGKEYIIKDLAGGDPRSEEDVSKIGTWVEFLETVKIDKTRYPTVIVTCENMKVIYRKHPEPAKRGFVFKYFDHDKQTYHPRIVDDRNATGHAEVYLFRRWQVRNWLQKGYGAELRRQKENELELTTQGTSAA